MDLLSMVFSIHGGFGNGTPVVAKGRLCKILGATILDCKRFCKFQYSYAWGDRLEGPPGTCHAAPVSVPQHTPGCVY